MQKKRRETSYQLTSVDERWGVCQLSIRQLREIRGIFSRIFARQDSKTIGNILTNLSHNLDHPQSLKPITHYNITFIIMNAIPNSMQKIALQTGRRFSSAAAVHAVPKKPFVPVRAASAKGLFFALT
jgi:hypothetical protein